MKIVISDKPPHFLDLEAPTLAAYPQMLDGREMWVVWCPHCRMWHRHGPGDGHRLAHCDVPGSPYLATGYNLARARRRLVDLYADLAALPDDERGPLLEVPDRMEYDGSDE